MFILLIQLECFYFLNCVREAWAPPHRTQEERQIWPSIISNSIQHSCSHQNTHTQATQLSANKSLVILHATCLLVWYFLPMFVSWWCTLLEDASQWASPYYELRHHKTSKGFEDNNKKESWHQRSSGENGQWQGKNDHGNKSVQILYRLEV